MKKSTGVLLSAGLLLSGCGSQKVSYDTKNFVDYYLIGRDFSTLNQLTSMSAADLKVIANIEDGMTETDKFGNKIGALAESWTHTDDYKVWTFTLKDAVWSTQTGEVIGPVTANDFVFAASYVLDPAMESYNAEYLFLFEGAQEYFEKKTAGENPDFSMVGVKALDEKTVQYTMEKGCPYLLSVLSCNGFYPVSEAFVKAMDDPKTYGSTPEKTAYNGAFLIESHSADSELKLVKNPNYWDVDNVDFETVTMLAVKDTETVKEYFERGEISLTPLISTQVITENKKGSDILLQKETEMMTYGLLFNNQTLYSEDVNKAMSNEDFRKSIFYGFDRVMLTELENPINPESIVHNSFCPTNFVSTSDGTDYTELGGLKQFHDMDLYQPELALEFKEKAKTALEAEGVSFPVVLKYWSKSGDNSGADKARVIKEILETNLGTDYVTVELNEYTTSFAADVRANGAYAFTIGGWNPDYADPINCLTVMKSNGTINNFSRPTIAGQSHFNYPEFDAMVEAADDLIDLDARYEAFANAEAFLLEHAYYCPLYISGGTYESTTLNEFTRMHSQVGIDHFKYKGLEAFAEPVTTEQYEAFRKEWEAQKAAQ